MISKYGPPLSKAVGPVGASFLVVKKVTLYQYLPIIDRYYPLVLSADILLGLRCEMPQAEVNFLLFTSNSHKKWNKSGMVLDCIDS